MMALISCRGPKSPKLRCTQVHSAALDEPPIVSDADSSADPFRGASAALLRLCIHTFRLCFLLFLLSAPSSPITMGY